MAASYNEAQPAKPAAWSTPEPSALTLEWPGTRARGALPLRAALGLGLLVVRSVAALGGRQAAALRGDRPALHAVRRRHLQVHLALAVQLAVALGRHLLELLLGHLVDRRGTHVLPHQRHVERHLLLDADVVGSIVAGGVSRREQ